MWGKEIRHGGLGGVPYQGGARVETANRWHSFSSQYALMLKKKTQTKP
jgi:hypothetical protein